MDDEERALLSRVRMTVEDAASARCELDLDGWPLLLVDRVAGCVRVNDLRSSAMFAHGVALPPTAGQLTVRAGAIGDELYVLLSDVADSTTRTSAWTPLISATTNTAATSPTST